MRFSFKKALAAVLTVVFVLSAFVSTLAITSFAAEQVGTLTVANTTVDFPCNGEGKEFTVDAVVTLDSTKTYVEFAYKVTNVPTGVSLTSATVNEVEYLRPDGIVHVSIGGETTTFTIVMKFTATGTFDAFAPAINFFYADFDEVDSTLDTNVGSISAVVAGHTPAAAVKENEVPATCGAAGSYDSVVYCSICNDEISRETVTGDPATGEHIDANPADGICDVCQTPVEAPEPEHVHAYTYQYDTKQHWQVCSNEDGLCDALQTEKVAHEFNAETGLCSCGLKEDVNLKYQGASVGYGTSSLQINFRVRNTVLALYDDVELVIIPEKYDLTTLNLVEEPEEIIIKESQLAAAGSTMKSYLYTDIQLYELGLDIDYMLRAYDAEGNYVAQSPVFSTSALDYLKTSCETSTVEKFRTVAADTLVVGYEQMRATAVNYPGSDLAEAPSIIEGVDLSAATDSIDVEKCNTVDLHDDINAAWGTASSCAHQIRKSVTVGKVPYITYRIKDSNKVIDLDKLSFKVTYTQDGGTGADVQYDKTFTTANGDITQASNGWISFKFDEVGLQDSDKEIVCEISYDGEVVATSTYSIESYLVKYLDGNVGDLFTALIKLGVSFRAYSL